MSGYSISDDPSVHDKNCSYSIYLLGRTASLCNEVQLEERLTNNLLQKRHDGKQPAVVAAVQNQVLMAMSGSGIVSQYMKIKAEIYDSYRPHLKSLCSCESAKMTNKVQEPLEEKTSENEKRTLSLSKMGQVPEFNEHEDQLQVLKSSSLYVEGNQEGCETASNKLGHPEKLQDFAEEQPTEIVQPGTLSDMEDKLRFLEEIGLDLSDDELEMDLENIDINVFAELNLSEEEEEMKQQKMDTNFFAEEPGLNLSEDEEETDQEKTDATVEVEDVLLSFENSVDGGEQTDATEEPIVGSDEAKKIEITVNKYFDDSAFHDELDYEEDSDC